MKANGPKIGLKCRSFIPNDLSWHRITNRRLTASVFPWIDFFSFDWNLNWNIEISLRSFFAQSSSWKKSTSLNYLFDLNIDSCFELPTLRRADGRTKEIESLNEL